MEATVEKDDKKKVTIDAQKVTIEAQAEKRLQDHTRSLTPDQKHVLPTTTAAEDEQKIGQRRINLIWETTQALVALMVTAATIYSALNGMESLLLGNAFTLIIALYFVRQNHSKVGGIGGSDQQRTADTR